MRPRLLLPSYVGASVADSSGGEYVRPEGVDYPVARARTSPVNWRCAPGLSLMSSDGCHSRLSVLPFDLKETSSRDFLREKAVSVEVASNE